MRSFTRSWSSPAQKVQNNGYNGHAMLLCRKNSTRMEDHVMGKAEGRVRFVGEAVVAVIAETQGMARDAADMVLVEYDDLPAIVELAKAATSEAPTESTSAAPVSRLN